MEGYSFTPKERHAKAHGTLFISGKDSMIVCRAINKKKLNVAKRLLEDLDKRKRDLRGKYYSNAVSDILMLLKSCEKNAESLGLDINRLFVYASASVGANLRRGRRRSDFGHRMKVSHVSIILVEKGKETATSRDAKKAEKKPKAAKSEAKTKAESKATDKKE